MPGEEAVFVGYLMYREHPVISWFCFNEADIEANRQFGGIDLCLITLIAVVIVRPSLSHVSITRTVG
jgi:hypothetical protein